MEIHDVGKLKQETDLDVDTFFKKWEKIPPIVEQSTMRQGDDPMPELDEFEAEVRSGMNGGGGSTRSETTDNGEQTAQSDASSDGGNSGGGGGVPLSRMSGVTAKYIPEVYEMTVRFGTTIGYKSTYAKKVAAIMNSYKRVQSSLTNTAISPQERTTLEDLQRQLSERLQYHAARLQSVKEVVSLPDDAKKLATDIISDMMVASGREISPLSVLLTLAAIPVGLGIKHVAEDNNAYEI